MCVTAMIGTSVQCRSDIPTMRPGKTMGELSAMGGSGTGIQESGIMCWTF